MLTVSDQNKIALFVQVQLEWCDFTLLDTLAGAILLFTAPIYCC